MIRPSFLFTSGAVLQREMPVPIFGECDAKSITVRYLDYTAVGEVENGRFEAILPPMPPSLSGELIFEAGGERLVLDNILTGDVYIAGGQSNMEHPLFCTYYEADTLERDEQLRLFTVPRRPYENADVWGWHFYPVRSVDTPWQIYDEESAECFSAVAAFFAKRLRRDVNIPIGVISCNWGATNVETWMRREDLLTNELTRINVDKFDARFADIDMKEYHGKFEELQRQLVEYINNNNTPMEDTYRFGVSYSLRHHFSKMIAEGPYHYKAPSAYRKTMLDRVIPYAATGMLWYQGESNSGDVSAEIRKEWFTALMNMFTEDMRRSFRNDKLALYVVQISSYPRGENPDGDDWRDIRDVHEELAERYEHVYTVPSVDVGEFDNIHPADKKPIGERLAVAALANEYGIDVPWRCPKIDRIEREGDNYVLYFNDGDGLYSKGAHVQGFFVTEGDKSIAARAEIRDGKIVINYSGDADFIGYCDRNYAVCNVYNKHALPLFPFRYGLK